MLRIMGIGTRGMIVQCSRCKREYDKTFIAESKVVCINCLTNDEIDYLVKELDAFWKKKSWYTNPVYRKVFDG